jgi:hypothetical protein
MARRFRRRIDVPTNEAISCWGAVSAAELGCPFRLWNHRPASADYRPSASSAKASTRKSTGGTLLQAGNQ